MSRTRGKSSGWTSFDIKQRQQQGVEPEVDSEPYPPMPNSVSSIRPCQTSERNNGPSARTFSSVLLPPANYPTLNEKGGFEKTTKVGSSSVEDVNRMTFEKLKELHGWAENSLIEDIMVVVNNDIETASTLLKAMGSTGSFDDNRKPIIVGPGSTSKSKTPHDGVKLREDKDDSFRMVMDIEDGTHASEDHLLDKDNNIQVDYPYNDNYFEDLPDMEWIMSQLNGIPIEPEYSEEDIYLSHRKDALKAMRSASHHSKAATNAFLRGDHYSAQQHSVKAQEQWITAQKLNADAAKNIVSIRNSDNDNWKLDLHGLHAAEAVQALNEHLAKIETQNPSILPNGEKSGNMLVRSQSLESLSGIDMDKLYRNQLSSKHKKVSLQVITGRGNHSKGQATLPIAVRTFLNENRYRFSETRPGVITVTPKFRLS